MIVSVSSTEAQRLAAAGAAELSDELERGKVVCFPQCPIALPRPEDLEFLRDGLASFLKSKNVSYHPESDSLRGLKAGASVAGRARDLLVAHASRVQKFLRAAMPGFTRGWTVGTTSFRPLQEAGRGLSPHASNELVHIDAGAYGATHGDRILRFFVNVNPTEDRLWISKGPFTELYRKHARAAGLLPARERDRFLDEGPLDRALSSLLRVASRAAPAVRMIDTSPYDRLMRRFHNYMKDEPAFRDSKDGLRELVFPPFSAWMVLTDAVSHACTSGQHALVDTFVVPLANCRLREHAPYDILKSAGRLLDVH